MHKIRLATSMRFSRVCLVVGTLSGIAVLGLGGHSAWADATCTPPNNGPTGPDAATFTYQCDGTYAGDWTNSYYIYDPSTGVETAFPSPDNSNVNGTNATTATTPDTPDPGTNATTDPAATAPPDPNTVCPTPVAAPDSSATDNAANNGIDLNNNVCSQSQSGDASVTDNGRAGDATSGNATTEVDVQNLVNSLSSTSGSGVLTFNKDINGDQSGDLILDPSVIGAGTAGADPGNSVGAVNTDMSINNAITATAVSGDTTVSGNGKGGDATSGDAETIVNLINMINSAVASGQSFIGTINIYGDYTGNILIPQSVIDQLLASNTAAGSGAEFSSANTNESIINNVNASATSGSATVSNNGVGGNATSGNASTNVTILNLTGSSVIGKNVLLVFVNVLGQWVGMILNAPTGATSAEFGGGITSNAAGTGNGIVETDANLSIINNVNASATSGSATVSNNGVGGNATSGNAETAVNILNVENSTLSLANWFGILFINVFGTWNGNFGIYTPPAAAPATTDEPTTDGIATTAYANMHATAHHFATFVSGNGDTSGSVNDGAVLGAATVTPAAKKVSSIATGAHNNGTHAGYALPAIGLALALLILATAERERLARVFSRK